MWVPDEPRCSRWSAVWHECCPHGRNWDNSITSSFLAYPTPCCSGTEVTSRKIQFTYFLSSFIHTAAGRGEKASALGSSLLRGGFSKQTSACRGGVRELGAEGDPSASHSPPDRLQPRRPCPAQAELGALLRAGTTDSPEQGGEAGLQSASAGSPVRSSKSGGL